MKSKSPSKVEQDPDEKVKIVIRMRPILNDEDPTEFVELEDSHTLRILKPGSMSFMRFSNILSSQCSQSDVFEQVKDSILSFLKGTNNTIFAYGQTGAGKTYSIIGDYSHLDSRDNLQTYLMGSERGILSRSLEMIMTETRKVRDSRITLSFFEIYNEKIYDLYNSSQYPLDIRESKNGQISIPDLEQVEVNNLADAINYLSIGLKKRATGSTHANSKSSRSHSIFQILYERNIKGEGVMASNLRIVDLAGSEKFKIPSDLSIQEREVRIQELTSINGSLSCLGHCISALIDKSRTHIPFRNSKLTRILSDSLIGQGRMKFIVCISPSLSANAETFSTLQFANRAKKAIVDRSPSKQHNLSKKSSMSEEFTNLKADYEREKEARVELQKQLRMLQEEMEGGTSDIIKQLRKENLDLRQQVKQLTYELQNRKTHTTNSMKSSYCQQQHSPQIINQHKGLLKLSVFKENNEVQSHQHSHQSSHNHSKKVSVSANRPDSTQTKKKMDFQKKMKKFMEHESPPSKKPVCTEPTITVNSNCQYSFNKQPHAQQPTNYKKMLLAPHLLKPLVEQDQNCYSQQPSSAVIEDDSHQHETFQLYDEYQSLFRTDRNQENPCEYDSNTNFIERTCKNMKVECLANLKEEMLRAKKELQNLQDKDTYLEKRMQGTHKFDKMTEVHSDRR